MDTNKSFGVLMYIILLFLIIAQYVSAMNPLPYEKSDLEDSFCLTNKEQATLQEIVQDIPKLCINPIENLKIDNVKVHKNKLPYRNRNIVVKGFNNSIIDVISIDLEFKVLRISFNTDLVINFEYKCDGELYGFPIFGDGKSEIIMNNLQVEIVISFEIVKNKQGKDTLNLKSFFYAADAIKGINYYFENLYNGNKKLSVPVLKLINTTWRTVDYNYGRFFTDVIIEELFEVVKLCVRRL